MSRLARIYGIVDLFILEIAIIFVSYAVLSEVGKSKGPVFDAIGPDALPQAMAIIVLVLALAQLIIIFVTQIRNSVVETSGFDPEKLVNAGYAVAFCALTAIYVYSLQSGFAPFFVLTVAYLVLGTVIMSQSATRQSIMIGAISGLVLGVGLQFIFTQILNVDLPV